MKQIDWFMTELDCHSFLLQHCMWVAMVLSLLLNKTEPYVNDFCASIVPKCIC